jgi:FdhD protein
MSAGAVPRPPETRPVSFRDTRSERVRIVRRFGFEAENRDDWLAVEEPLQIHLCRGETTTNLLTIMRTPGHDAELAVGLLVTEGVLVSPDDVLDVRHADDPRTPRANRQNIIVVSVRADLPIRLDEASRATVVSSACGVCGRALVDGLRAGLPTLPVDWTIPAETLYRLPNALREAQAVFERTGGLHATGLFDLSGALITVREDIGRHNSVDKVVGSEWLAGRFPFRDALIVVSGRAGFEIVQKALRAGIALVASVGAPSSLAVDLALEYGMTLVGFLRDDRMNVYAAPERIR